MRGWSGGVGEYFTTQVTGFDEREVNRSVAELIVKGFEVVAEGSESHTAAIYKRTNSVGSSKTAFVEREERGKFIVVLRRKNVVRISDRGGCCIGLRMGRRFGLISFVG